MQNNELHETDLKILNAIKHEARKTYEQIAKEVGISRTAVKNRIQSMEDKGIITGYETITKMINEKTSVKFIVDVETVPHEFDDIKNYLENLSYISELYITSGSCHLHAVGVAVNQETMQTYTRTLYKELLSARRLSVYSVLATCKHKDGDII